MNRFLRSITLKITGATLLLLTLVVVTINIITNYQMDNHFQMYLLMNGSNAGHFLNGSNEKVFFDSFHHSIHWLSVAIVALGTIVSYFIARGITIPLCKLTVSAKAIAAGDFAARADVKTNDEVGELAISFNDMAGSLQASEARQLQLLADIAHELKTPLTIIQGNLEGMLDGVVENSVATIQSLLQETAQLKYLVNDLRDLMLLESADSLINKDLISVGQLLERTARSFKPLADAKNIIITTKLPAELEIAADSRRISQIIGNLLTNAIRHSLIGGKIEIDCVETVDAGKAFVEIAISDNGEGIEPADLPFIFDCCFRSDRSRTKDTGGSGIGLAVVKRFVAAHGGTISVKSKIGNGTTFCVRLPKSDLG
ncbi:MAG: HAMP domain-containing sensor histidine kinase [Negativicutes bacterium]|jgi:two-component system sensor histidine kinase BaeS